jgi:hypothetical protein
MRAFSQWFSVYRSFAAKIRAEYIDNLKSNLTLTILLIFAFKIWFLAILTLNFKMFKFTYLSESMVPRGTFRFVFKYMTLEMVVRNVKNCKFKLITEWPNYSPLLLNFSDFASECFIDFITERSRDFTKECFSDLNEERFSDSAKENEDAGLKQRIHSAKLVTYQHITLLKIFVITPSAGNANEVRS